jgi:4-amino-4-deoxy-L-arabinose transferase-like glycosyltransferase
LVLLAAVTVLGAALRFYAFSKVHPNPYYDAAVRSMGLSWHNLFFGAGEPGGGVSVDKTPVDLWLQVASVKLFGFSSTSLRLPEALAGTAAIPLLYDLVRRLFDRRAGLVSAAALAVMPMAVLTARSDTMDSIMMVFALLAGWCLVRAVSSQRRELLWVCLAGASMGLAFEVKLFESLVALPALLPLYLLASRLSWRRRVGNLLAGFAVFVVVALSWVTAASLTPARDQPYPLGSTDGSVWNVVFVFNGVGRLSQSPGVYGIRRSHSVQTQPDRGFRRLFGDATFDYRNRIGGEIAAALLLGLVALLSRLRAVFKRPASEQERLRRAGVVYLGAWLLTGFVLFSWMSVLLPRYLEAFTPAVAGSLGVGLVAVSQLLRRRWVAPIAVAILSAICLDFLLRHRAHAHAPSELIQAIVIGALIGLAALAVAAAIAPVRGRITTAFVTVALILVSTATLLTPFDVARSDTVAAIQDSGSPGRQPPAVTRRLSAFLRAHRHGARYELATFGLGASSLIVHDALPVLFIGNLGNRELVPQRAFVKLVREGQVRFVLIGACPHRHCDRPGSTGFWIRQHGRDVSAQIRLPRSTILQVGA